MKKHKKRAFTIVELVIVIAVIGVLAAILIPTFSGVIKKANDKSALSDARNLLTSFVAEKVENESLKENIVIFVEKANQYYIYGYSVSQGQLQICKDNPLDYDSLDDLIYAKNYTGDPASYSAESDPDKKLFYLVPSSGNPYGLKGATVATKAGGAAETDFTMVEVPEAPEGSSVFWGTLLGGSFDVDGGDETENPEQPETPEQPLGYSITFQPNGGSFDSTYTLDGSGNAVFTGITTASGMNISEVQSHCSRNMHVFDGWEYVSGNSPSTTVGSYIYPERNCVLKAKWVYTGPYTITFTAGEGETIVDSENILDDDNAIELISGTSIKNTILAITATHATKTFSGWKDTTTNAIYTASYFSSNTVNISRNMTLAPTWSYTLSFSMNNPAGTTVTNSSSFSTVPNVAAGYSMRLNTTPTLASGSDYVFSHWTYQPTGVSEPLKIKKNGNFVMPAEDTTLTANWTEAIVYFDFDMNQDGDCNDPEDITSTLTLSETGSGDTIEFTGKFTMPDAPDRAGFTFNQYTVTHADTAGTQYFAEGAKYHANQDDAGTANRIRVTAQWYTNPTVTITDGSNTDNVFTEITTTVSAYGGSYTFTEPVAASAYTITGWSYTRAGSSTPTTISTGDTITNITSNITITAAFEANVGESGNYILSATAYPENYADSIVVTDASSNVITNMTIASGTQITVTVNAAAGRTFLAWTESGIVIEGAGSSYTFFMPTRDYSIIATFVPPYDGGGEDPEDGFGGGTGTESDPYQIWNYPQLLHLATKVNDGTTYDGKYFRQMSGITVNDNLVNDTTFALNNSAAVYTWPIIGNFNKSFNGNYDGGGHGISGLYYAGSRACVGLFGNAFAGELKNINIVDSYFYTSNVFCGGIAGTVESGRITNCTFEGYIGSSNCYVGGITGSVSVECTVSYCINYGKIVSSCISSGNFFPSVGGVVGCVYGFDDAADTIIITRCGNEGIVCNSNTTNSYAIGGILGYSCFQSVTISECYNTGNVYGADDTGGILGYSSYSYSGFTPENTTITDCYNTGNVYSTDSSSTIGGIVGRSNVSSIVTNCYNGSTGNKPVYPIGGSALTISNCYYTAGSYTNSSTGAAATEHNLTTLPDGFSESVWETDINNINNGKIVLKWQDDGYGEAPDPGTGGGGGGGTPPVVYTLRYLDGFGNLVDSMPLASGATTTIIAAPEPPTDRYVFNYWTASGVDQRQPGSIFTMPAYDTTITAKWIEFEGTNYLYSISYTFGGVEIKNVEGQAALGSEVAIDATITTSDNHRYSTVDTTPLTIIASHTGNDIVRECSWEIQNAEQLAELSTNVAAGNTYDGSMISLGADITLNGVWTPIGNSTSTKQFKGTFDGNGYAISGLTIDNTTVAYQGLFGYVNGATIKDVAVVVDFTGYQYVGGIAGYAISSEITGCTVRGTIRDNTANTSTSSHENVGGIVGYAATNVTISQCVNAATISPSGTGYLSYVGGIAGYTYSSTIISECYNVGNVTGYHYVGGIVGYQAGTSSARSTVRDSFNAGEVTATYSTPYVGGITGYPYYAYIYNCYNVGTIDASGTTVATYCGGIVGYYSSSYLTYENTYQFVDEQTAEHNAYYTQAVTSSELRGMKDTLNSYDGSTGLWKDDYTGGQSMNNGFPILSWQNPGSPTAMKIVTVTYYDQQGGTALTVVSTREGRTISIRQAVAATQIPVSSTPGVTLRFLNWTDGTNDYDPEDTYTVPSDNVVMWAEYEEISGGYVYHVDYKFGTLVVGSTEGVAPNGEYAPVLPEYVTFDNTRYQLNGAITINVVEENYATGGTANYFTANYNMIIDDEADLRKVATDINSNSNGLYSGLTVKLASDITLTSNWTPIGTDANRFKGTFDGNGYAIIGLTITGSSSYQGLFGYINTATVRDVAVLNANISGYQYVGGIVGYANSSTVTGCTVTGTITYNSTSNTTSYIGGIAGYSYGNATMQISQCVNAATISGNGTYLPNYAGGIVGGTSSTISSAIHVKECYNAGNVTGYAYVGGIVGFQTGTGSSYRTIVRDSFNAGTIIAESTTPYVGGISGYSYRAYIYNCYNTGTVDAPNTTTATNCGGIMGYSCSYSNTFQLESEQTATGMNAYHNGLKTEAELAAMTATLNAYSGSAGLWKDDFEGSSSINNGFPILTWQTVGSPSTVKLYTITYLNESAENGGTAITTIRAKVNRNISIRQSPTGTEIPDLTYVFKNWTDGTNDYDPEDTFTVPDHDVTIWAEYDVVNSGYLYNINCRFGTTQLASVTGAHDAGSFTPDNLETYLTVDGTKYRLKETPTYTITSGHYNEADVAPVNNFVAEYVMQVQNQADLEKVAADINAAANGSYAGLIVELANDITLTGNWTPIGTSVNRFMGTFDGKGYGITGLEITGTLTYQGLFGYLNGATVKNMFLNVNILAKQYFGAVAGYAVDSDISGCTVVGTVSYNNGTTTTTAYGGGIVGFTSSGTTISQCVNAATIENGASTGYGSYIGGITGYITSASGSVSSISQCYNAGNVTGYQYIGGIVGYHYGYSSTTYYSQVLNCYNGGTITATSSGSGGISGYTRYAKILNSYNTGTTLPASASTTGGIVGTRYSTTSQTVLTNAYQLETEQEASMNVHYTALKTKTELCGMTEALNSYTGSAGVWKDDFAGSSSINNGFPIFTWQNAGSPSTIKMYSVTYLNDSAANGGTALTVAHQKFGRNISIRVAPDPEDIPNATYMFTGWTDGTNTYEPGDTFTIPDHDVTIWATYEVVVGGYQYKIDCMFGTQVIATYTDTAEAGAYTPTELTEFVTFEGTRYRLLSLPTFTIAEQHYNELDEIPANYFTAEHAMYVEDADDLAKVADDIAADANGYYAGLIVELGCDITLPSTNWTPIGSTSTKSFKGTFDGKNHTIDGMTINTPTANYLGLFGYTTNAVIKDVTLTNIDISGRMYNGAIAAWATTTTITNCKVSGTITCASTSASYGYTGGIVGYLSGVSPVTDCVNNAAIEVTGTAISVYYGGIAAYKNGTSPITNCVNNGDITGKNNVGGIVGYSTGVATISDCINTGDISGNQYSGGIAGNVSGNLTITNCANEGVVSNTATYAGGIVGNIIGTSGSKPSITNCFNVASISGTQYVGGIAGYAKGYSSTSSYRCLMQNNYNAGDAIGTSTSTSPYVGGITGYAYNMYMYNNINSGFVSIALQAANTNYGNISGYFSSVTANANYSLSDVIAGNSTNATLMSATELRASDFVTTLNGNGYGTAWKADADSINNGFPTLTWTTSTSPKAATLVNITYVNEQGSSVVVSTFCTNAGKTHIVADEPTMLQLPQSNNVFEHWNNNGNTYEPGDAFTVPNNDCTFYPTYSTVSPGYFAYKIDCMFGDTVLDTITGSSLEGSFTPTLDASYTISGTSYMLLPESVESHTYDIEATHYSQYAATPSNYFVVNYGLSINTKAQLESFRDSVNSGTTYEGLYVMLTENISLNSNVLSSVADSSTGDLAAWTPIGNNTNRFCGHFVGADHTISGLYINNTSTYQGLFGYIENGSVNGVKLVDSYVKGNSYVGGITGTAAIATTISNCSFTGTIVSTSTTGYVGGIVGQFVTTAVGAPSITDCIVVGSISSTANSPYMGGIAGYASGYSSTVLSEITNCNFSGSVEGYTYAGGIGGYVRYIDITNCKTLAGSTVTTKVTSNTTTYIGGIAGYVYYYTNIIDCTNNAAVSNNGASIYGNCVGGIAGYSIGSGTSYRIEFTNCTNNGAVSGYNYVGGIIGQANSYTNLTDCTNTSSATVTSTLTSVANGYIGGIAGLVGSSTSAGSGSALLRCVNNATVSAANAHYTGGIAGCMAVKTGAASTVTEVVNTGAVTGSQNVGGIIGYAYGYNSSYRLTVKAAYNTGAITSTNATPYVGGIMGRSAYTYVYRQGMYNIGTVSAPNATAVTYVGAIHGYTSATSTTYYAGLYSLDGLCTWGASSTATENARCCTALLTADALKAYTANTVLATYSTNWTTDSAVNDGYPVFNWQLS